MHVCGLKFKQRDCIMTFSECTIYTNDREDKTFIIPLFFLKLIPDNWPVFSSMCWREKKSFLNNFLPLQVGLSCKHPTLHIRNYFNFDIDFFK